MNDYTFMANMRKIWAQVALETERLRLKNEQLIKLGEQFKNDKM